MRRGTADTPTPMDLVHTFRNRPSMFAVAYDFEAPAVRLETDPRASEIAEILELRARVMASRDILYCSPAARTLIEDEIPRLVSLAMTR